MRRIALTVLAAGFCLVGDLRPENRPSYAVNPEQSRLEIHVYREGFLKAFGHDHLISAKHPSRQVQLAQPNLAESSVSIIVETGSLAVLDPGESEKDRKEVQATMLGEKVLDAAQYPQIRFTSSRVRSLAQKEGAMEVEVEGTLRLHGVEKSLLLPMRVRLEDGRLSADGEFSLLQSDYGIVPIKVGGGAVRVKDKLKITFHIVSGQLALRQLEFV
jgi:polyisoprenoid-binding protein YceI